jgi:phage gpG-like protein
MNETTEYFAMLDRVAKATNELPRIIATEAVNFSKERFRAQNWVDFATEPWRPRKTVKGVSRRRSRRAILVDTGRLRRSIRVVSVSSEAVVIGTDVPYAQAHNDGFSGTVKQNVKAHQRRGRPVRAHTRNANIRIPRRRFLGQSMVLEAKLNRVANARLIRAIKGN